MPITDKDLLKLTLVSSPEMHPSSEKALFVATRLSEEENRYTSSIWIAGRGWSEPLTSGPGDVCPRWRPQGDVFAFIRRDKNKADIMIKGGGEAWRLSTFKTGVRWMEWMPDGLGLLVLSSVPPEDEEYKSYSEREVLEAETIPVWFNGEGWVFDRRPHLFLVEYPSGRVRRLTRGDKSIVSFTPIEGGVVYAESYKMLEPRIHRVRRLELETGREEVILDGYTVSALSWSQGILYMRGHKAERGYATHHKIYVVKDGEAECLTCSLDRNTVNTVNSDVRAPSCSNPLQSLDGVAYFQVHDGGRVHVYKVEPEGEPEPVLNPGDVVVDEYSISEAGIAYTMMTPTTPKELYIGADGYRATSFNEWIRREALQPRRYKARNGDVEIDYWILGDSRDCSACKPWILYIHGGPKTSYGYAFIHELQYLASKGFTVIYSNPRGSDGYTEEYADIRGKYGTIDYQDLMAVVDDALTRHKDLDPEKGGVTGGSYGGWMTNWIITSTRRFKAAVTQRSCSNWISFYGASDIGWHFAPDQLQAPPPWEDPAQMIEKSPLFRLANAKTPLLIIHATDDYRCPLEQAIQLFTALKVLGVEAKLAVFPGENHDLSRSGRPRQRLARLRLIAEWMEQHLSREEQN